MLALLHNCISPSDVFQLESQPARAPALTPGLPRSIMGFSQDGLCRAHQPACSEWGLCADMSATVACFWFRDSDYFFLVPHSLVSEWVIRVASALSSSYAMSRRLASQRHTAPRNRRRTHQRNWLRTIPAGFITGSKRRIRETRSFYPSFDGLFCSRHSEEPSKKLRQLGHQIHNNWPADYCSDCSIRKPGPNSLEKDCDNPKTSTSKSCEESSQHLPLENLYVPGDPLNEPSTTTTWDSLPNDIHVNVLQRVDFRDRFRFKVVSKDSMKVIEGDVFRQLRDEVSEGMFTAINYYIKKGTWRFSGYDLLSKSWRTFPTLSYLPPPDAELFKEYSVCGHGGLMCAEVSKFPIKGELLLKKGELVVFNPLTGSKRALPPLHHPRIPVLVNLSVDSATKSYKVVVAGSSSARDEHLSKKVEVFDSLTSKWKEVCDLPGPDFGLNEHQAGVCLKGKLFLISFLENGGRGVVAFDMAEETWLQDLTAPIPWSSYSNTLQLVESDGKLFLFSEQEQGPAVEHCIDELEFPNPEAGVWTCRWRNVVRSVKSGGRGLQVYPEHTCVGFGARKLCIFNTLNRDGVVYDMRDGEKCEDLESPPANQTGDNFFSLNPASFTLQPNFAADCYGIGT